MATYKRNFYEAGNDSVFRAILLKRVCAILILCTTGLIAGCASSVANAKDQPAAIKIESVRLTAAGHYIDLRYRVLDPERANEVLGPGVKPLLIDQATGRTMAVPTTAKLGSLRQTQATQRTNRTYFVLFVNSAPLKRGSVVTAQLGDFRIEDIVVE